MKKKYAGSQPEQTYKKATSNILFLDRKGHDNEYEIKYLNRISDYYKDMGMIDENALRDFVTESMSSPRLEGERLLREYVRELSLHSSSIRSSIHDDGLMSRLAWPDQKKINEEWNLMRAYVNHPYLLNESSRSRAQMLCEQLLDKFKAMVSSAGGKVVDFATAAAKRGKELGEKGLEKLKQLKDVAAKVFMQIIEAIPGGKTVYEFVVWAGGALIDKLKEIGQAIGDKVKEWFKTAKKKLIDIVVNVIFQEDETLRQDLYKAMGVTEDEVCLAQMECRRLGINDVDLLNEWMEAGRHPISERRFRRRRLKLLREQEEKDKKEAAEDAVGNCPPPVELAGATADEIKTAKLAVDKGFDLGGSEEETQEVAKLFGFLTKDGQSQSVNPEKLMRGRAGKVVDYMMDLWSNLAEKNPAKYIKPLAEQDFWEPFKTGFGLAGSAMMGILSLSETAWDKMVMYIDKIKEGIGIGNKEAMDDKEMTQTKSGSFFANPKTLGPFLKGIIEGSNIEVIVRALSGDPTMAVEAGKRIVNMIVTAIREMIKKKKPEIEQHAKGQMDKGSKEAQSSGESAIIDDETKAAAAEAEKETAEAFADTMDDMLDFGL